jgi:hypothetical protein
MLRTVNYGIIRIVAFEEVNPRFDFFLGSDLVGEWDFYQLAENGEVVAVENFE